MKIAGSAHVVMKTLMQVQVVLAIVWAGTSWGGACKAEEAIAPEGKGHLYERIEKILATRHPQGVDGDSLVLRELRPISNAQNFLRIGRIRPGGHSLIVTATWPSRAGPDRKTGNDLRAHARAFELEIDSEISKGPPREARAKLVVSTAEAEVSVRALSVMVRLIEEIDWQESMEPELNVKDVLDSQVPGGGYDDIGLLEMSIDGQHTERLVDFIAASERNSKFTKILGIGVNFLDILHQLDRNLPK